MEQASEQLTNSINASITLSASVSQFSLTVIPVYSKEYEPKENLSHLTHDYCAVGLIMWSSNVDLHLQGRLDQLFMMRHCPCTILQSVHVCKSASLYKVCNDRYVYINYLLYNR